MNNSARKAARPLPATAKQKRKKLNLQGFAANSKQQLTEQEVKSDFARWIASELRVQVANWKLALPRSKPSGRSNQRSYPCSVSRTRATPLREQFASTVAAH
jgi:hypothetical protein